MSQHTSQQQQHGDWASANTAALIGELAELALDPALESCCRRDLEAQIARERVRLSLQAQDRVDVRARLAASTVARDPGAAQRAAAAEAASAQREQVCAADGELAALRAARLRQLQAQSAAAAEGQGSGFGRLNPLPEGKLLALLADPPGRGLLVVHLAVQGHAPCDALDECLEAAAAAHPGTYFARCVASSRRSALASQLQLPHGLPALLVARRGALLGKAPLAQFGGGADIWEEEVLAYLRRFHVLSSGAHSGPGGSRSSDEGSSDAGDEGDDARGGAPCEVCGRTYAHEHVRALYASAPGDRSSDDEGGE